MQIHVAAIGRIKEPYLRDGIAEYMKRLSSVCTIHTTEIPEEQVRTHASSGAIADACNREGVNLLKITDSSGLRISLDPLGKAIGSEAFAAMMKNWEIHGPHQVAFLIGGPHGLSGEVKTRSDLLLSLSPMTFPHQVARFILMEQIYRAFSINRGLPYHR